MTHKVLIAVGILGLTATGVVLLLQGSGGASDRSGKPGGPLDSGFPNTADQKPPGGSDFSQADRVVLGDSEEAAHAEAPPGLDTQGGASASSPDSAMTPTQSAGEELETLGLELLNEVLLVEETEGLSSVSDARLKDWGKRSWSVHVQLVANAFDDLREKGSIEILPMSEPNSAKLDALYDCAYSWTSSDADAEGVERVEVCVYPRHEYAVLNELMDLKIRLDEFRRARSPQ